MQKSMSFKAAILGIMARSAVSTRIANTVFNPPISNSKSWVGRYLSPGTSKPRLNFRLDQCHGGRGRGGQHCDTESLAAPIAFAGTPAVRCDVAAPAIPGAKLLRNGLQHVTFAGRQL